MRLFRNRQERAEDAAGRWVAIMRDEPSDRQRRRFIAWYNASPSNRRLYDGLAQYWDMSPGAELTQHPGAELSAIRTASRQRLALAALVVGAVSAAAILAPPGLLRPGQPPATEMMLLATTVGEVRRVSFGEGTRLILDTDSAMRVDRANGRLKLERGRARVDAARRTRPLQLQAGAARIEAAGTVVDVRLEDGAAIVTPISGTVTVSAGDAREAGATRLPNDQQLVVTPPGKVTLRAGSDRSTAWPSGMLEFDGARLGDVVAEANRYSRRKLRLADPALEVLRVTGAYRAGEAEGMAQGLAAAFDLSLARSAGGDLVLQPRRR